jgi:hypothetical protein
MVDIKLNPGDDVRVFDQNGSRIGQPDGGWPGKVVKVGRTLVTIAYGYGQGQFRLDTRKLNDNYGHRSFMTPEEVAQTRRQTVAWETLNKAGFQRDYAVKEPPLGLLEALAKVITEYKETP